MDISGFWREGYVFAKVDVGEKDGGKARLEEWVGVKVSPFGNVMVGPKVLFCLLMQNVEGLM